MNKKFGWLFSILAVLFIAPAFADDASEEKEVVVETTDSDEVATLNSTQE